MRLLFISQLFDPEYSIKGIEYLKGLQRRGVKVQVITTFPNYPTGTLFPGYKQRLWKVEEHDGIRVLRVWTYISRSKSKVARAASYTSFMLMSLAASFFCSRPDLIYAYHPQVTTGLVASVIRFFRGIPFITDVQDLWPDALAVAGVKSGGLVFRIISKLCNFVYDRAAHIVVLSKGYKEKLISRGVPEQKVSVIYNWSVHEEQIPYVGNVEFSDKGRKYLFCYTGNIGSAQALQAVVDAFSLCQDLPVELHFYGDGVERSSLEAYAKQLGTDNVFFHGYVKADELRRRLFHVDVLVAHLKDEPLFKITIPSKTQSGLCSGRPLLMAVGGEANAFVEDAGAGVCALPEDIEEIKRAIKSLLDKRCEWEDMAKRGWDYYQRTMSQRIAIDKTITIFSDLGYENQNSDRTGP